MLCPSITCAVRSANRTPCAGHVEFHTRARPENPSIPNPCPSLAFVRPRDRLTSTAGVSGPGFTPTGEHVAVSCAARHEPRARRRANPARFPLQLLPLLGPYPSSVAVVVSILPTHTCVLRRSHSIPGHSHRDTRLRAHACPPSSPLHTATSHTPSLSQRPFHSHTPYYSLTRGH